MNIPEREREKNLQNHEVGVGVGVGRGVTRRPGTKAHSKNIMLAFILKPEIEIHIHSESHCAVFRAHPEASG